MERENTDLPTNVGNIPGNLSFTEKTTGDGAKSLYKMYTVISNEKIIHRSWSSSYEKFLTSFRKYCDYYKLDNDINNYKILIDE